MKPKAYHMKQIGWHTDILYVFSCACEYDMTFFNIYLT